MLGFTQSDNTYDRIYVFLENTDIKDLRKETIIGTYFGRKSTSEKRRLELSKRTITDTIENIIDNLNDTCSKVDTVKDKSGLIIRMNIQISSATYLDLVETGYAESYSGDTRICIHDANKLYKGNAFDQITYNLFKTYEKYLSNKRIKNPNIWHRLWQSL